MRFLSVDQLVPGTRLARPLYGAEGLILLRENFELTDSIICRLRGMGYHGVYVNDEISEGIIINDVVDEKLRIETANRLEDINVGILSVGIGVKLEYNRDKLIQLGMSGMLHDIGKKFVPTDILDKSGKLSKSEFQVIQTHPERGYEMLYKAYNLSSVTKIGVLQHHERFDGSGYPNGLKGHEISMFGRIIAVSDTYDAMTSDRAYHKASQPSEVIEYLFGNGNQRYDLRVVDYFSKCIAVYPVGSCVELSDGTKGIVLKNYSDSVLRPVIRNIQNKQIIDLKNDVNYLGICISGQMQS
ncbi:MAG: metal dependent phosphohydrolase [Anaerocolumna sp.]|nr:metal dependent phosphohydrolase [Anaerocolumna sp.]